MLFSWIVFMSRTLLGPWQSVVLVFILQLNIASNSQIPLDNEVKFDGEFDNFLRDLGSIIYKPKKTHGVRSGHDGIDSYSSDTRSHTRSTAPPEVYRRNQNAYNTQKAVLGDVLMMKLVSYYEDKYKLTHFAQPATETITLMGTSTINNIDSNYYQAEVFDNKPALSRRHHGMDRRNQRDMKKGEEYVGIPEVVIL